jgi:prephenate dehydrogenase
MQKKEIGIIGLGRFGRFAASYLRRDFKVFAYDPSPGNRMQGIRRVEWNEIATKPVILLCVPISFMETVCHHLAPFLQPGQLVIDTCSVKEWPLRIMTKLLPRHVEILGTHPLFGPDSARRGIQGQRIALCPGRCCRVSKIRKYLTGLGLKVVVTSAAQHDREMAKTQALFHFLARGVASLQIPLGELTTPGPAKLFHDFEDVQNDSLQLFRDLESFNRFAPPLRTRLLRSLEKIDRDLKNH